MALKKFRIDIVSDVVCPWCIIGYGRLMAALDRVKDRVEVDIFWHPFELDPNMPKGGQNLREHMAEKYGTTPENSQKAREMLTGLGQEFGFQFNYSEASRMYNTFDAHRMMNWIEEEYGASKKHETKMALFKAYFTDALAVDDLETLISVARGLGVDTNKLRSILETDAFSEETRAKEEMWQRAGISAVPAFIIDQKYLISGAQDSDSFVAFFEEQLQAA